MYRADSTQSGLPGICSKKNSSITNMDADKCTIEVQNNLAFKNFIANSCSIKGAFVGTAVDYDEHDLFLKTVRLREYPDEYVYVSVDSGEGGDTEKAQKPEINDTLLVDQYKNLKDSFSLSITAKSKTSPANLSYQWYKGTEALEGKTSRNLVLANVKASDAGNYHCVITDTIAKKTTDSSVTVITVK